MLLRAVINMALGQGVTGDAFLRERIAGSLAALLVGLPLWLAAWWPAEQQARDDGPSGAHARRSIVRKGYLYLALFASVIGGMAAAVALIFQLLRALLTGQALGTFLAPSLNSLQLLALFAVVLVYHLIALRRDGVSRAEIIEATQAQYPVLVIGPAEGDFAEKMRMALNKQNPRIVVAVMAATGQAPEETDFKTVILPASVAFDPPEGLRGWLSQFGGRRIIVPDDATGALVAGDARQASHMASQLADGQEVRLRSAGSSAWRIVMYVFAALFALQLLFLLVMLGISSLVNR
jgi:hypothetical protein